MESVGLHLTPKQMERLATGGAVMISPAMTGGAIQCALHPSKMAKMQANHAAGKKFRLTMEPSEMSGGSWKKFKKVLKKGWEGYKKHVVPVVGPKIRKSMKYGLHAGLETLAAVTGQPEAVALAHEVANTLEKLVDLVGDKTGGFGNCR